MFGPESKLFGKASKLSKSNSQYPGQEPGDIPGWMQAYEYDKGTEVMGPDFNYYRCLIDHVSNNFFIDLANGNWVIFAGPGLSISDKNFVMQQVAPALVWSVPHNLNKRCTVQILNNLLHEIEGDIRWIDDNSVEITFNTPTEGWVYCN